MNEIKEIFESIGARIRSPFFGYVFFVVVFWNWKVWFYLLFAHVPTIERFQYFDDNSSTESLIIWPLIVGFLLAMVAPWVRWFFIWVARYPTTKRILVQARSEQEVLKGKHAMASARMELQAAKEEGLILEAKRDVEIGEIQDEDVREKLQRQIDALREDMRKNDMALSAPEPNAELRLDFVKKGNGYRFVLTNISSVIAKNINLKLDPPKGEKDPIPRSEYEKFPVPMLSPGGSVRLLAPRHLGSPTAYTADVTWENPNGTIVNEELFASL